MFTFISTWSSSIKESYNCVTFSPSFYRNLFHTCPSSMCVLLSRFSRVRLCATPWTAAHQAPPSLGFSRQEHWSGLPFPSPMHESEVAQSRVTLSDPMDCSLPGSSIHGIFQARVLEWGAIAFSWDWIMIIGLSKFLKVWLRSLASRFTILEKSNHTFLYLCAGLITLSLWGSGPGSEDI